MKTDYAILMIKKKLEEGIYYFIPETIIEGNFFEEEEDIWFQDSLGNEYLTIHNTELIFNEVECGVGYVISENDLLNKYPNLSIHEAKAQYFQEICQISHFGFHLLKEDIICIIPMYFKELLYKINEQDITMDNNVVDIDLSEINQPEYNSSGQIMSEYEKEQSKAQKVNVDNNKITDNITDLISNFIKIYNSFDSIDNLENMKKAIKELMDSYVKLNKWLDTLPSNNVQEEKEMLYTLYNLYNDLLKIDDFGLIQSSIKQIQKNQTKHIEKIISLYKKNQEVKTAKTNKVKNIDVRKMKQYFDQIIIGQEEAKRDVISTIVMNQLGDSSSKNSCLLVGPTGSGKTLLVETISQYLNLPMEIVDTTQLTVPGYQGANIEDFLLRLLIKSGEDLSKAEKGIIVFDEIDKKGSLQNNDVSGKGVLNTLLPFLQGTTYNLNFNGRVITFNTQKLTIFATGAFTDVAEAKSKINNHIGFNIHTENDQTEDIYYYKLDAEDFVKYGKIPIELIGRFSTISQLSGHTENSLKEIIKNSLKSPLLLEQTKLQSLNIDLSWDEFYIDTLVKQALQLKTGARSLKNIVEYSLKMARWEVLLHLGEYQQICLNGNTPLDNTDCILLNQKGEQISLKEILREKEAMKLERKQK